MAASRVYKGQGPGVQGLAPQLPRHLTQQRIARRPRIERVPQHRVATVAEVDPHLVSAPSLKGGLHQARPGQHLQHTEVGHRPAPALDPAAELLSLDRVAPVEGVEGPLPTIPAPGHPHNQGEVVALNRVACELRGQGSWQKAVQGLEQLLETGYAVSVRATLDGQGEDTLCDLARLLDPLGVPEERVYGAPVAKVGRAKHGLELSRAGLFPEPTIVSDGLYWHPLLIDPSTVMTTQIEPLESALQTLVDLVGQVNPIQSPDVR